MNELSFCKRMTSSWRCVETWQLPSWAKAATWGPTRELLLLFTPGDVIFLRKIKGQRGGWEWEWGGVKQRNRREWGGRWCHVFNSSLSCSRSLALSKLPWQTSGWYRSVINITIFNRSTGARTQYNSRPHVQSDRRPHQESISVLVIPDYSSPFTALLTISCHSTQLHCVPCQTHSKQSPTALSAISSDSGHDR